MDAAQIITIAIAAAAIVAQFGYYKARIGELIKRVDALEALPIQKTFQIVDQHTTQIASISQQIDAVQAMLIRIDKNLAVLIDRTEHQTKII
jgi:hypothetical protein